MVIFSWPIRIQCSCLVTQFNKREYKTLVEELGGVVAEEISELQNLPSGCKGTHKFTQCSIVCLAFLIADKYYRTHKYLFALAASIPCIHFNWLKTCADQVIIFVEFNKCCCLEEVDRLRAAFVEGWFVGHQQRGV